MEQHEAGYPSVASGRLPNRMLAKDPLCSRHGADCISMCAPQFKEYLERAETIKAILDGQLPVQSTTANGAVGQKARPRRAAAGNDKDVSGAHRLLY